MNIIEGIIREYDIECACLSMLISKNKISEELFMDLKESDKDFRNILIGKIQINNDEVKEIIKEGISQYVELFSSSLKDRKNIIEVSKDAIFVINETPDPSNTKLNDYVNFVLKGTYYLLIEIPITKNGSSMFKIYKNRDEIKCRFGKLNPNHPAYPILFHLLDNKIANDSRLFFRNLSKFRQLLFNDLNNKISSVISNEYLFEAISELM